MFMYMYLNMARLRASPQNETGMMLVSLAYNAPNGKLTATVLKCKELPAMDMNGMAGQ